MNIWILPMKNVFFNQHTWCHPKVGMSTAKKPSSRAYFLGLRLRGMELVPFVVEIALGLGKHAEYPLITCCSHLYPLITFCHSKPLVNFSFFFFPPPPPPPQLLLKRTSKTVHCANLPTLHTVPPFTASS